MLDKSELDEKAKRLAELQSRIAVRSNMISTLPKDKTGLNVEAHPLLKSLYASEPQKPGATAASTTTANASQMFNRAAVLPKPIFATTKANLKMAAAARPAADHNTILQTLERIRKGEPTDSQLLSRKNPYLEPLILEDGTTVQAADKRPKRLKFHMKGKFISAASKIRKTAYLNELRQSIDEEVKRKGIDTDIISDAIIKKEPVPEVEWWDEQYLIKKSFHNIESIEEIVTFEFVNSFVYHPPAIPPPIERKPEPPRPLMLTKKERKKLRRQRRLAAQKERREMIRLGLAPAEETKLKMSNYMKVLSHEALQEPTKAEALVKAQMQKRLDAHQQANQERKLTPDEKAAKKKRKLKEDLTGSATHMAVFRVLDLSRPQWRFKIDANATQNYLVGVALLHRQQNLIIVEGGPKAIQKYARLMLKRIRWNERLLAPAADPSSEPREQQENQCLLVWQGLAKAPHFTRFELKDMASELSAIEYLRTFGLEHLWTYSRSLSSVAEGAYLHSGGGDADWKARFVEDANQSHNDLVKPGS